MKTGTLEQITDLASAAIAEGDSVVAMTLARWIMANLAESAPCGFEMPQALVTEFPRRGVVAGVSFGPSFVVGTFGGAACTAAEARAFARGLLAAADEAERLAKERHEGR